MVNILKITHLMTDPPISHGTQVIWSRWLRRSQCRSIIYRILSRTPGTKPGTEQLFLYSSWYPLFFLDNRWWLPRYNSQKLKQESEWLRLMALNLDYINNILKRAVVTSTFLRLLSPPVSSPLSISSKLQFVSHQSILFLFKSQLLASAEELYQCLVCEERFQLDIPNIPSSAFRRSLIWSRLTHQVIRSLSVYLDHISRTSPPSGSVNWLDIDTVGISVYRDSLYGVVRKISFHWDGIPFYEGELPSLFRLGWGYVLTLAFVSTVNG